MKRPGVQVVSSQSSATEIDEYLLFTGKLIKFVEILSQLTTDFNQPLNPSVSQCHVSIHCCTVGAPQSWHSALPFTSCWLPRPTHKDAVRPQNPEQWAGVRWSNELSSWCHKSLLGPMLPLYGFITAEEYEAILVHHFPIFHDDDLHAHCWRKWRVLYYSPEWSQTPSISLTLSLQCRSPSSSFFSYQGRNIQNQNTLFRPHSTASRTWSEITQSEFSV